MTPVFLSLDEVIEIHRDMIERYGGSLGVRDAGLLESAVAMPQAGFGEQYFHSDLFQMAAAYLFHIVENHPFVAIFVLALHRARRCLGAHIQGFAHIGSVCRINILSWQRQYVRLTATRTCQGRVQGIGSDTS